MEPEYLTLARAAYDRYGAVTDHKNFMGQPMPTWEVLPDKIKDAWIAAANPIPTVGSINKQVGILLGGEDEQGNDLSAGEVSDGYHTFNELYDHRITLYIALARNYKHVLTGNTPMGESEFEHYKTIWRSTAHSDGSVWPGWFLLGINPEAGIQITYHLPMTRWNECGFAVTLDKAPEFDGHSSADVLDRLKLLGI